MACCRIRCQRQVAAATNHWESNVEIPVLIEATGDGRIRARSGEPLPLSVEGATRDEALAKLRDQVQVCFESGKELLSLTVGTGFPSLPAGAGVFRDDPYFGDWQQAIAEYRRQKDVDEGVQ
jgi:hypothetical protein